MNHVCFEGVATKAVCVLNVILWLLLNTVPFSSVHDIEQFYELWLKNQKTEKSDETASHCSKENGKQIHMPTDYAEVTVSTCAEIILFNLYF